MKEIRFRYTVKRTNGHIFSEIFSLENIENGDVKVWFENNHIGETDRIHKDQYIEKKDMNNVDIYENDMLTDGICKGPVLYDDFISAFGWTGGEDWGMIYDDVEIIGNYYK